MSKGGGGVEAVLERREDWREEVGKGRKGRSGDESVTSGGHVTVKRR